MGVLLHILIGAIVAALGLVALKYNYQLSNSVGQVGVFEKYLGAGGTFAGFKLLSILAILLGFLYMTSLFDPVMRWVLSPLIGVFHHTDSSAGSSGKY